MAGEEDGDHAFVTAIARHPRTAIVIVAALMSGGTVAGMGWVSVQRDIGAVHEAQVDMKGDVHELRQQFDKMRESQATSNAKLDYLVHSAATK